MRRDGRTLLINVLAAATVALIVAAGTGWYYRGQASDQTRAEASYTCGLVMRMSGTMADFVNTDAQLRVLQVKANIGPRLAEGKPALEAAARASNAASTAAAKRWTGMDLTQLHALRDQNCQTK